MDVNGTHQSWHAFPILYILQQIAMSWHQIEITYSYADLNGHFNTSTTGKQSARRSVDSEQGDRHSVQSDSTQAEALLDSEWSHVCWMFPRTVISDLRRSFLGNPPQHKVMYSLTGLHNLPTWGREMVGAGHQIQLLVVNSQRTAVDPEASRPKRMRKPLAWLRDYLT